MEDTQTQDWLFNLSLIVRKYNRQKSPMDLPLPHLPEIRSGLLLSPIVLPWLQFM